MARISIYAAALAVALAPAVGSASGPVGSSGSVGNSPYVPPSILNSTIYRQYVVSLKQLRDDGLALREQDGGHLSAAHAALIQQRLDRIHADYRRRLHNNDRFSVDAVGNPI